MKSSKIFVITTLIIFLGIGLLPLNMHAADKDVNVVNTPNVNVVNTPNVNVSNTVPITGNVGISGTPNVNVTNIPGVVVVNDETTPIHVVSEPASKQARRILDITLDLPGPVGFAQVDVRMYSRVRVMVWSSGGIFDVYIASTVDTDNIELDTINTASDSYTAVYDLPGEILSIGTTTTGPKRVIVFGWN